MRKILSNRVYDTETAKELAHWNNGLSPNDFNCCRETLYIKRTGEFFIHGEGHGFTKYADHYPGGGYCWGEKIVPLEYDEAREWAESKLYAEDYEEIFGTPEEDKEDRKRLSTWVSPALFDRLNRERARRGVPIQDMVIEALEEYLDR